MRTRALSSLLIILGPIFWQYAPCACTIINFLVLSLLDLVTSSLEKWGAAWRRPRKVGVLGWKSKVSPFQELPVELMLNIMSHTPSQDLRRLILTTKFMDEIFKTHKNYIFRRIQRYQFPEFLEWFGEMPRFDGPLPGDSRTSEQIQCLRQVVLSFNWRREISMTGGDIPGRSSLHLLERYAGWRYLYFLSSVRCRMERDAKLLRRLSLEGKLDITWQEAEAMVLCLSRMSWNPADDGVEDYAGMSEADRIAELRMRVENRLRFFRKEPPALQELMRKTLKILTFRIGRNARLHIHAAKYQRYYAPAGVGSLTRAQIVAGWENLVSQMMAKTLLGTFFFNGVTYGLELCEPLDIDRMETFSSIFSDFIKDMISHLEAVATGTVPRVAHSLLLEGSLWAAGLEFPTLGWFVVTDSQDGLVLPPYQ